MHVRYLGHSSFLLEFSTANVLVDPCFHCDTFAHSPRMVPSPVHMSELPPVSVILISNEHEDHFDKKAIEYLCQRDSCSVIAHDSILSELNIPPRCKRPVSSDAKVSIRGLQVAVHVAHYPRAFYPMAYLITGDDVSVYHAGDTDLLEEYPPELRANVALLPIGGGNLTMDIVDAVKCTKVLKPDVVIPMHYNTFSIIQASPDEFAKKIEKSNLKTKPVVLAPNGRFEFKPGNGWADGLGRP